MHYRMLHYLCKKIYYLVRFRKSHNRRRIFSAIILLMVMIMQVGVKAFHQHHYAVSERMTCSDCDHHRVHSGHITSWDGGSSDCVVCQLFSSPFSEAKTVLFKVIAAERLTYCICSVAEVVSTMQMHIIPRAPPACLL